MEEFDDIFESESDSENEEVFFSRRPKMYIRDMQNPLDVLEEAEFKRRYRFSRNCVMNTLLPMVHEKLSKSTNRGLPMPPIIQLLLALRFYAVNSFQLVHGDLRGLSQSSISRALKNVSVCFAEQLKVHVRFPQNENGFVRNTAEFFRIANFPCVSGAIDCTHIKIENPGGDHGEVFRNRKGWFSLNVQVVCGPHLEILDIVVRHPGSTHDSVIFNRSAVRTRFQEQQIPGLLIGDNGYACQNFLLTPVIQPLTIPEENYNVAHKRTRNVVERLFGVWKRKFFCLRGGLRTKLDTSAAIICATAVLYNIGLRQNENNDVDEENIIDEVEITNSQDIARAGLAFRSSFIAANFN